MTLARPQAGEQERARLRDHVARHRLAQQDAHAADESQTARPGQRDTRDLTRPQRQAAQLWADGYTFREIGDRLGVTKNAVKDRVFRARWRLGVPPGTPTAEARREIRARL